MRARLTVSLLVAGALALLLSLSGCAPAVGGQPLVAVLNGPAEGRIQGSAELLQSLMSDQGPLEFGFVNAAAMRFAETHNDLFHDRALTSGGRIARSYGAPYAVLIGASTLDRTVTLSHDKSARSVDVTVQIEAIVVKASTDKAVARISSQTFEQVRVEKTDTALPPIGKDPTVQTLRDQAEANIAPAVVGVLWNQLGIHPSAGAGG
jgi:hypothetical protein